MMKLEKEERKEGGGGVGKRMMYVALDNVSRSLRYQFCSLEFCVDSGQGYLLTIVIDGNMDFDRQETHRFAVQFAESLSMWVFFSFLFFGRRKEGG